MKKIFIALVASSALLVAGCSSGSSDTLAAQWQDASDKGYIAGDGSTTSISVEARTAPVEFAGISDEDQEIDFTEFEGAVTVVNFWYAGCAPCRAEAKDLVAAHDEFAPQGVKFLGVNTRDGKEVSRGFAEEFGIEYPSILDTKGDRGVQRAFAGQIPLNAVPTTLVLDSQGRVAHRILGQILDESQLRTLINETLAES
ncbi:MAG TPA: TlpA disulfide reductase family protein [Microbacteriaceae bacterium]|nr:TlpA disulfide reductase family protein [Microbacteriaceae bacterium]